MKVSLVAVMSVNGLLARDDKVSTDWSSKEDKAFFKEFTMKTGVVVMGRKTFETIGSTPLSGRLNVVMTRKPHIFQKHRHQNLFFTNMEPKTLLKYLGDKGFNHVAVIGGPQIYSLFLEKGLITDLYLTIEPLFLSGRIGFKYLQRDYNLHLEEIIRLSHNTILLHYSLQ
ncbi:dihydrofolate reductase family protein [Kosmotoga pacifica]|uniref:dihydrofolate reductase n=1 Tax=Kosmotoga pacifica TaxID=1330330 RepID=A0A0G2Z5H8_9BACT|nr:dihydrofolate reductase family protein [Kosmotoga pacifica]AKI96822.1 hypothetical protein IX53_02175 [Kosmotoga pacifica]